MEAVSTRHAGWIRAGLIALPLYGLVTIWATLEAQPDQVADPEAWARFVASPTYVMSHTFGTVGGAVLAILGVFALGSLLARSRAGRLGLVGMTAAVVGHALGLVIGGISAYATPAVGRAYLAGIPEVMQIEFPVEMTVVLLLALLLMLVGNTLLGIAVWQSGTLPRAAGATWLAATVVFYLLGAVAGMATTGASLPTQPIGAGLMVIAGAWLAWSAFRPSASRAVRAAQPTPL